jgi:ribose 5-phosphate isomerase B
MNESSKNILVYLAADHGGFELKEKAKQWLDEWGYQYQDLGASEFEAADDYTTYAFPLSEKVGAAFAENAESTVRGVLFCRSGGGMTIAANKVKHIRAVPVYSPKEAKHARNDNHANVISLAGDWTDETTAKETLKAFLETPGSTEERHLRRLQHISAYQA